MSNVASVPAAAMELRDVFAGQALVGMLPKGKEPGVLPMNPDQMAEKAYEYADAMIRARSKSK
jgi:hypothetical protein